MPRLKVSRFWLTLLTAALLVRTSTAIAPPAALAHQVEISEDIGGTLHIEPNDTPRAGEKVLAWVALTREGGDTLSLNECDCSMKIYAQPRKPEDSPLLTPATMAVEGEAYPVVPGAQFTFPTAGAYTVVMAGRPRLTAADGEASSDTFSPFELAFDVTVAAGKAADEATRNVKAETVTDATVSTDEPIPGPKGTAEKAPAKAPRGVAIVALATGAFAGIISVLLWRSRQKS